MLYNLKRCYTATIGTGTLTIGAAILNDFTDIPDGTTVSYSIMQGSLSAGFNAEVGRGTYSAGTLARDTVLSSTNGGAKIALDGTAQVVVTALAEDFVSFSGGVAGQVAAWSSTDTITAGALITPASNILTLTNAAASTLALNIGSGKTLTLTAADNYTLTVPESLTVAGRNVANTYTAIQKINVNSTAALLVEQDGVKDNVLIVDTTNGRIGVNMIPTQAFEINGNFRMGDGGSSAFRTFNIYRGGVEMGGFTNADSQYTIIAGASKNLRLWLSASVGLALNVQVSNTPRHAVFDIPLVVSSVEAFSTTSNSTIIDVIKLQASYVTSTGAATNGFGVGVPFFAETATNETNQLQARIASSWVDATNATRKAKLILSAYDTSARVGVEIEADGSAAKIGLYGAATVARATTAGTASTFAANTSGIVDDTATFDGYTIGQVVKALRDIGILT